MDSVGVGILGFVGIIVYLAVIAAIGVALWWIIRTAVRRALRDHQLWLESRTRDDDAPGAK
ncbi:MAG TPA: hypothetical protein VGF80_03365 [Galbitalea sp.]|jgi:hypothetical protein